MRAAITITCALLLLSGCTAAPAVSGPFAAPDDPFLYLPADELERRIREASVDDHLAFDPLINAGEHSVLVVFRDASGKAEYHELDTDFWIVRKGEGILVTGGEIVEPRAIAFGEIRGNAIEGGTRQAIRAGDVVNIPPRMNHQLLVEDGSEFIYLIIKIREHRPAR